MLRLQFFINSLLAAWCKLTIMKTNVFIGLYVFNTNLTVKPVVMQKLW